jgi:hypothetical protein
MNHDTPGPGYYDPPDPDAPIPCSGGQCRKVGDEFFDCLAHRNQRRYRDEEE